MSKAADLASLASASETALSNRNIVINGAMQISQRATSATGKTSAGYFAVDRNYVTLEDSGTWTITQTADGPSGFANCLRYDCTTADAAVAAAARMMSSMRLEGQSLQQLKKGTSDAEYFTISFWVKSNKTGNYVLGIYDHDTSGGRQVAKLYTINSADTWEYKSITYPPDTSGPLNDDNGLSLQLQFYLAAGTNWTSGTRQEAWASVTAANRAAGQTVQLSDNTANDWSITGVQMEVGTVATPFENLSFGQELALCQRYYEKSYDQGDVPGTGTHYGAIKIGGSNVSATTSYISGGGNTFKVTKRARPTVVVYDPDGGTTNQCQRWTLGVGNYNNQASVSADISETNFLQYSATGNSASGVIYHYTADAEL